MCTYYEETYNTDYVPLIKLYGLVANVMIHCGRYKVGLLMRKVLYVCGRVMNILVFNLEMAGNVTRFCESALIFAVLFTYYCGILTKKVYGLFIKQKTKNC